MKERLRTRLYYVGLQIVVVVGDLRHRVPVNFPLSVVVQRYPWEAF